MVMWACDRLTDDADFGKNKSSFQMKLIYITRLAKWAMRLTYRWCRFLQKKNHLFRWSSFWSWRVCKQAKLSPLGHRKTHAYIKRPTHPKRVTVWCGLWFRGIIERFFFENEQEEAVTVKGDRYRALLNEFLFIKIEEEDISNIWFQQDGATCHTAEATLGVLRPVVEDRIISRRADVVWPPQSCDLTSLDVPSKISSVF